jgi:hypothetical protein
MALASTMCLQFEGFVDVGRARACPRVLSLVYPSRTRGLLSDRKRTTRTRAARRSAADRELADAEPCGFDDDHGTFAELVLDGSEVREQERRLLFGAAP